MSTHIFLCGFMGCGKTTVGRAAAKQAGVRFIDLDEAIVAEAGMPIPQLFEQFGEAHFRALETDMLRRFTNLQQPAVIATGGGALVNSENAAICREGGTVVFLDVPFDRCYERICGDSTRPNAASRTREQLLELYEARRTSYLQNSDITLQNETLSATAKCIVSLLSKAAECKK